MKAAIHPKYFEEAKVTCACGNSFSVGMTIPSFHADVCSSCHPFYTGQMRYLDTRGRVDSFMAKQEKAQGVVFKSKSERRAEKKVAQVQADISRPQTLEELRKMLKKSK